MHDEGFLSSIQKRGFLKKYLNRASAEIQSIFIRMELLLALAGKVILQTLYLPFKIEKMRAHKQMSNL
jgi:hypothetical protein